MSIRRSISNEPGWVTIVKPTDENRTSTTTLADDGSMLFAMEVNTSYYIDIFVNIYVRTNPDLKWGFSVPASGFFRAMQLIEAQHTTITQSILTALPTTRNIAATTDNYGFIRVSGPYANGANAGNFAFQWAQVTSDGANAATVVAGSALRYFKF